MKRKNFITVIGTILVILIFCVVLVVADQTTVQSIIDGSVGNSNAVYPTSRDADSGNDLQELFYLNIGQQHDGIYFYVKRTFISFPIPELISVLTCTLNVDGAIDKSIAADFDVYIHGAHDYAPTLTLADFSKFNGRQTAQAHNGTVLNDTWNTSSYSAAWNAIAFNAAGRDSIVASSGDTLRIALISAKDFTGTAPGESTEEYIRFSGSGYSGVEPYISITYEAGGATSKGYKPVGNGDPIKQVDLGKPVRMYEK